MGLRFAVLAYSDGSRLDVGRPRSDDDPADVMSTLFPRTRHREIGTTNLVDGGFPERGVTNVCRFTDGWLLATREAASLQPTILARRYLKQALGRHVFLYTQQPAYDVFAYGRWVDGVLVRALSVNPVRNVLESIGEPEPWEEPFWGGRPPEDSGDGLPFHPLTMGDSIFRSELGMYGEGLPDPGLISVEDVTLRSFRKVASSPP